MNLKTYLQTCSQGELARKLEVTAGAVSQWANGTTTVTAERCIQIEQATNGQVRCEDLRPDVAWSVLRLPQSQPPTLQPQPATECVAQGCDAVNP